MKPPISFVACLRLAAIALLACGARAAVTLPALLTDHMVLQRDLPIHVWGHATPGEAVSVTFQAVERTTTAGELGRWSVYLPPSKAGGPFTLTVRGSNEITLRDILVGDVWVASGQSNMEFETKNVIDAPAALASAQNDRIRLFHVRNQAAYYPMDDVTAKPWEACTPETVAGFSAVAYFFGADLQRKLDVPIGLIEASWGGTPAEAWTSLRALSEDAALMPVFAAWAAMTDDFSSTVLRREIQRKEWQSAVDRARAEGKQPPGFPWEPNMGNSWMPAGLYNGMIAPLTRMPIRGAIWYQGESNAGEDRAPLYAHLFGAMIRGWRHDWGQGGFPFLFVQLASFKTGANARWPELREAQAQTLALANTGMAVTIDIGTPDDIHPRNKQEVGRRLALAGRSIAYGEKVEFSGPLYWTSAPEGSAMRVWFDHTGGGLVAKGGTLAGFEVAGADGKFVPAQARVERDTVVVSDPGVPEPRYVRYAWSDNPVCNLYNQEGLPASPFRSHE